MQSPVPGRFGPFRMHKLSRTKKTATVRFPREYCVK
uniref:Uncharacterized protein n=1 Tax=Anguilla anguilla TaxID=7936 RepID=A0A0E9XA56_ANGAN